MKLQITCGNEKTRQQEKPLELKMELNMKIALLMVEKKTYGHLKGFGILTTNGLKKPLIKSLPK